MCRLNLFHDYAKRRWGSFVGKILLHTGLPCPNRLKGGCVFCSAKSFTPYYLEPGDSISEQIAKGKKYIRTLDARLFIAGFQIETSSAGTPDELIQMYSKAWSDMDCVGLIISTRPDYVNETWLNPLAQLVSDHPDKLVLIELGLQSARDDSLAALNRNHTFADFVRAAKMVRSYPRFELGCHLILGIPSESFADMRDSIQAVCGLGIQHLKLHHLQIIKNTTLAQVFQAEPFRMLDAEEYLDLLCRLLPEIGQTVVIHRLWSTSKSEYLIAPRWGLTPNRLFERLFQELEIRDIRQGQNRS